MMNNKGLLAVLAVSLLLSCTPGNKESDKTIAADRPVFSAALSATADPALQRFWASGDKVAVFNTSVAEEYVFEGTPGSLTGTLKSTGSKSPSGEAFSTVYAVYPYGSAVSVDAEGCLRVKFPNLVAIGNEVSASVWVAVGKPSDGTLHFQCVTTYMDIPLYGEGDVRSITVTSLESIKGMGKVAFTEQGPTVSMPEMDVNRPEDFSIILSVPQGNKLDFGNTPEEAAIVRLPLPATAFTMGMSLTAEGNDGKAFGTLKPASAHVAGSGYRSEPVWLDFVPVLSDQSAVPFKDEAVKAYLMEKYDFNKDGVITFEEARLIIDFNMRNGEGAKYKSKIKSGDDFQYLSNLFNIELEGTGLSSLAFRNNPGLGQLIVRGNPKLESIDFHGAPYLGILWAQECNFGTLDVSALPFLCNLYCSGNSLKELDLSTNGRLMNLDCGNNQLTELDLSHNPLLEELYCSNNQLTSLDLRDKPLRVLHCSNNRITQLDMSQLPKLENLICSSNPLTSLDVSKNTKLTSLSSGWTGLEQLDVTALPELQELECQFSSLASLDVSGNGKLTSLDCSDNRITSLELRNLDQLVTLRCGSNQLKALDVSGNPKLKVLSCGSNAIAKLDVSGCTELTEFFCGRNEIESLDVSGLPGLKYFDCYSNKLTSLDVSRNPLLESLNCNFNDGLTILDVSNNPHLVELNCWNHNLKELWLKEGQTIPYLSYNPDVTVIKYK